MANHNARRDKTPLNRRWIIRASAEDDHAARERARSVGVRFSDYIRRMGVSGKIVVQHDGESGASLAALTTSINRVGNLINQQMAIAHSRGELPSALLRLNDALARVIDEVLQEMGR